MSSSTEDELVKAELARANSGRSVELPMPVLSEEIWERRLDLLESLQPR
jgi:hypothetical protein